MSDVALALPITEDDRDRLVRLLALFTGRPAEAEDLAQEALYRAVRAHARTGPRGAAGTATAAGAADARAADARAASPPASLFAWLSAIGRNLAIDWSRRERRRPRAMPLEHACAEATDEPSAEARALATERAARESGLVVALRAALGALPDRERAAFCLFYEDGLGVAAIAARLDAPAGTVKSWLHRARARLRERLRDRLDALDAEGPADRARPADRGEPRERAPAPDRPEGR